MSHTLYEYRREMLRREPSLGHVENIASLTTTTIVVNRLRTGSVQAGKGRGKYLLRAEAALSAGASVDRERVSSDFSSRTGTYAHDGLAYTDVTATDEEVEVLEHAPTIFDQAVQQTLKETRFLSYESLPLNMSGRNWLGDFSWIDDPSDISRIGRSASPVLTRNRHMSLWHGYSTAGALVPDGWTIAGSGATFARSTTRQRGAYSLAVTRSGTDATVDQSIRLMESTVGADSLRGHAVTGVLVGRSGSSSSLRVRVTSEDGAGNVLSTTNSDYHDGDDDWQEVTAEHTVHADAEVLRVKSLLEQNETAEVNELYLMYGTITDTVRRDAARTLWVDERPRFEQGQPLLHYGASGRQTGQLVIESYRPYAQFDQARIDAGLADSDSHDAPLELVAEGALFHLYAALEPAWEEAQTDNAKLARKHRKAWDVRRANHLYVPDERGSGWHFPPSMSQRVSARIR